MRRKGSILLPMILTVSLFALVGINKPASAVSGIGSHTFTVQYLSAYISDLKDPSTVGWFTDPAPDEWSFTLFGRSSTEHTHITNKTVSAPGMVDLHYHWIPIPIPIPITSTIQALPPWEPIFYPSLSWSITGNTYFNMTAKEWFMIGDMKAFEYYRSSIKVNVPFSLGSILNSWIENNAVYGDVTHYYNYYISNSAPSAAIATPPSFVKPGVPVAFTGSGVDPEGDSISYHWDFGDGGTSTSQNPTHIFTNYGTYTVKLRVTDYFGEYREAITYITVTEVSIDNVFASDDRSNVGSTQEIGFHAKWMHNGANAAAGNLWINGTSYPLNGTGWVTFPVTNDAVEKTTWFVTQVDCSGMSDYQLHISDPYIIWDKVEITLSTPEDTVEVGINASVTITATYQYDGATFDGIVTLNDTDFMKSTVGTFYYTTQSAAGGAYDITAFESNTLAINFVDTTAPTAEAGPDQTVNEDTQVTLDGSASSDNLPQGTNSGIKSYKWTFSGEPLNGPQPTCTFDTPGVYSIILNVTDASGNWDTDTVVITVLDITKPVARAGQDRTTNAGTAVTFDASGSSDNVDIISYEWNFGDNTALGTGKTTDHTYASAGTYTVTLTVKDAAGNSATHSITVTAHAAQGTPTQPDGEGEGFPMWTIGAVVAIAAVAIAAVLLLRKQKKPPAQTPTANPTQS